MKQLSCEMCGRLQDEVQYLVAGPGLNVCSECILEMAEMIAREHPQWRDEVIRLVDACSIVCVLAGYTSGIVWELLHVAATCPLEKILLFLPPRFDECAWSRFLQSIGTQAPGLPLPRSLEPGTLALAFRPEAVVIGFSGKPISANYGEIARSTLQRLQERQAGP